MRLCVALLFGYYLVANAWVCRADQPECTGDRHYDECGQYCPVTTTTVDPPTTTTTLAEDGCAPCPAVICGSGETIYNVTVNRCPTAPNYIPCRMTKHGLKCPKPRYHGRVLAPLL